MTLEVSLHCPLKEIDAERELRKRLKAGLLEQVPGLLQQVPMLPFRFVSQPKPHFPPSQSAEAVAEKHFESAVGKSADDVILNLEQRLAGQINCYPSIRHYIEMISSDFRFTF